MAILRELGTPLLIHQPSYSMLNRWIEEDLLDVLGETGVGCIAFSPLAQGMLTSKYLNGIPEGSRAAQGKSLSPDLLTEQTLAHVRALNELAAERGQSLAQLALAWALRDRRITSVLIGASSVAQLDDNLGALDNLDLQPGRSWPGSTSTRSTRGSTCGPSRARPDRPGPRRLPQRGALALAAGGGPDRADPAAAARSRAAPTWRSSAPG